MSDTFLKDAIQLAYENIDLGGGPFGAVIEKDGQIIARAGNNVTSSNDPTAHAEILAIRSAAQKLGTWNLEGCVLYSSCEPCPMCLGAIYWAHIDKVHYACNHEDARQAGFDDTEIYQEIGKPVSVRRLPMSQSLREKGLSVFEKWINKEDKEEY